MHSQTLCRESERETLKHTAICEMSPSNCFYLSSGNLTRSARARGDRGLQKNKTFQINISKAHNELRWRQHALDLPWYAPDPLCRYYGFQYTLLNDSRVYMLISVSWAFSWNCFLLLVCLVQLQCNNLFYPILFCYVLFLSFRSLFFPNEMQKASRSRGKGWRGN